MAKTIVPRKRGRKTNIERSLIKVASLARAFGDMAEELQAGCSIADAEVGVIDKTLIALEGAHWYLTELSKKGSKQLGEVEPTLIDMVKFARKLCTRRDSLFLQQAAYQAELAVVDRSLQSLKQVYDYLYSCFEAKYGETQ